MGGHVFESKGLSTPRMSPQAYQEVRTNCMKILEALWETVACPAEAPGKADHGDVDFLVSSPRPEFLIPKELTPEQVAKRLGAVEFSCAGDVWSFAVLRTDEEAEQQAGSTEDTPEEAAEVNAPIDDQGAVYTNRQRGWKCKIYAQVDVQPTPTGFMAWELFMKSYGDLWQIIGSMIRDFGLTATNKGLHYRIPEIENVNKKASMLYLTHDVPTVMMFLRVRANKWKAGFDSMDESFNWCTESRFFSRETFLHRTETANDRQRMKKRPMFRQFAEEYLPAHPSIKTLGKGVPTREEVQTDVFSLWQGAEQEYLRKIAEYRRQTAEKSLWSDIADVVPEEPGEKLNLVIRGLKRWVDFDDGGEPLLREEPKIPQPEIFDPKESLWHEVADLDEILYWVGENWEIVRDMEKARVKAEKEQRAAKRKLDAEEET